MVAALQQWIEPQTSARMHKLAPKPEAAESGFWARPADGSDWHSVRGPDLGPRRPICHAPEFARTPGEARLPLYTGATFGPVCEQCARFEGHERD